MMRRNRSPARLSETNGSAPLKKKNTMWNLVVFAVIGLLAGAAARLLFPGREPMRVLATMALGATGGLIGGVISWANWPDVHDQFQSGNLIVSALGAFVAIAAGAGLSYARGIRGYRTPAR